MRILRSFQPAGNTKQPLLKAPVCLGLHAGQDVAAPTSSRGVQGPTVEIPAYVK